jgi:hypothetical protein
VIGRYEGSARSGVVDLRDFLDQIDHQTDTAPVIYLAVKWRSARKSSLCRTRPAQGHVS